MLQARQWRQTPAASRHCPGGRGCVSAEPVIPEACPARWAGLQAAQPPPAQRRGLSGQLLLLPVVGRAVAFMWRVLPGSRATLLQPVRVLGLMLCAGIGLLLPRGTTRVTRLPLLPQEFRIRMVVMPRSAGGLEARVVGQRGPRQWPSCCWSRQHGRRAGQVVRPAR